MRVVVVGSGNGGQSLAGDLIVSGHRVEAIYDRFPGALTPIRNRGGIQLVGPVRSGFAEVPVVTSDISEAVSSGDTFLISVPAFAHEWIAEELAPYMKPGHTVVLGPGYFGGSVLFRQAFQRASKADGVLLVELSSLPYATRMVGPAQVGIKAIKRQLLAAALPHRLTPTAIALLAPLFPQLIPADTVLAVGLANQNPVSHVPTYLLNLGRVRDAPADSHFDWHDWVTDDVRRVQEALDNEIQALGRALGVEVLTSKQIQDLHYRGIKWQIVQPTGTVPENAATIPERFITEDVPEGLVPLASLGLALGVPTPVTQSLIELSAAVMGTNYAAHGRTLERLGLPTTDAGEILAFVQ